MNNSLSDAEVISKAVSRIVEAVHPLRVILFGSAARGEMTADSDVDFLVVMPDGTHRLKTSQKLHLKMFGIPLAVDFIVATASDIEKHKDNIGLIYRVALREGRELYVA
jgi:predicted nucleotidyltransferase